LNYPDELKFLLILSIIQLHTIIKHQACDVIVLFSLSCEQGYKSPVNNHAGTSTITKPFSYYQNPSSVFSSFSAPISSYQFTLPSYYPPMWTSHSTPVIPPLHSPTPTKTKSIPTWGSISKESKAFFNYPFVASSTPVSPISNQGIKFQPFSQSPFAVPSSSSFNVVADNSIREMGSSKMFGLQVKPWVGEKVHDEGVDDLVKLTLGTGKSRS
jgi:brassinosteroid resistant 1/2